MTPTDYFVMLFMFVFPTLFVLKGNLVGVILGPITFELFLIALEISQPLEPEDFGETFILMLTLAIAWIPVLAYSLLVYGIKLSSLYPYRKLSKSSQK